MERAVQIYAIINLTVIGMSHVVRPRVWVDFFVFFRERGEAGVFAIAILNLIFGSIIVAFHSVVTSGHEHHSSLSSFPDAAFEVKGFLTSGACFPLGPGGGTVGGKDFLRGLIGSVSKPDRSGRIGTRTLFCGGGYSGPASRKLTGADGRDPPAHPPLIWRSGSALLKALATSRLETKKGAELALCACNESKTPKSLRRTFS